MTHKKEENKTYEMWLIDEQNRKKDIKDNVEEAYNHYIKKGRKIISIEISKEHKGFTIKDISVRPNNDLMKNTILLQIKEENKNE